MNFSGQMMLNKKQTNKSDKITTRLKNNISTILVNILGNTLQMYGYKAIKYMTNYMQQ